MLFTRPTRKKFATLCMGELTKLLPDREFLFDEQAFRLRTPGDCPQIINLSNAYTEVCQSRWYRRARVMRGFLLAVISTPASMPADFLDVRDHLLPGVREHAFFAFTRLNAETDQKAGLEIPVERLSSRLSMCLLYDLPNSMQYVTSDNLKEWQIDFAEAKSCALKNLESRTSGSLQSVAQGLYVSDWCDNYDASRILLTNTFRGLDLLGDPIVWVPSRNRLIVCGADDIEALAGAIGLVQEAIETDRAISCRPLRWAWPELSDFELDERHVCYPLWRKTRIQEDADLYEEQKALLDREFVDQKNDLHVGSYLVLEQQDSKERFSLCTVARDVDSLIPVTEYVLLVDSERSENERHLGPVPWHQFLLICKENLKLEDVYPPRYRVTSFPDNDHLDKLRTFVKQG